VKRPLLRKGLDVSFPTSEAQSGNPEGNMTVIT
jgi:hypothetical protein